MKINLALWERAARTVLGVVLLLLVVVGPKTWWGLLGLVPLLTGLAGFCPLCPVLGVGSCPRRTS